MRATRKNGTLEMNVEHTDEKRQYPVENFPRETGHLYKARDNTRQDLHETVVAHISSTQEQMKNPPGVDLFFSSPRAHVKVNLARL